MFRESACVLFVLVAALGSPRRFPIPPPNVGTVTQRTRRAGRAQSEDLTKWERAIRSQIEYERAELDSQRQVCGCGWVWTSGCE